jgi:hypothetical protein
MVNAQVTYTHLPMGTIVVVIVYGIIAAFCKACMLVYICVYGVGQFHKVVLSKYKLNNWTDARTPDIRRP